MKILIAGANGMLAHAVIEKFKEGNELYLTERVADGVNLALDITDQKAVIDTIAKVSPDVVINCAAYTAVDRAETQEELAYKINAEGPKNLAIACKQSDCALVHISTDYVFGGNLDVSEEHQEDDPKTPESAYGRTKLAGEQFIEENCDKFYIFRTAWLYGEGPNFVRTMIGAAKKQIEAGKSAKVSVVCDQHGSPTFTEDLTDIIRQAVDKNIPYGIYSATNLGNTTWDEFTREIYKQANIDCEVESIDSETYEKNAEARAKAKAEEEGVEYVKPVIAKRPFNSQMSKQKLIDAGVVVPTWQDALSRYLVKEGEK